MPPLIREAPAFPLPDPTVDPQWYGEIWIRYPMSQTVYPVHLGTTIKCNFELRKMMNAMASELFEEDKPPIVTPGEILECKSRLDMWFTNLPDPLTPTKIVLPDQIKIQ